MNVQTLMMRICANRNNWSGDAFVQALEQLVDAIRREPAMIQVPAEAPKKDPPKTRDEALERFRERTGHVATENCPHGNNPRTCAVRKNAHPCGSKEEADLERERRPKPASPFSHITKTPGDPVPKDIRDITEALDRRKGEITDEDRATIRRRYREAKAGKPRIERGWVRHIAKEYGIHETKIYNIIYSDPAHEAVPRS